MLVAGGCGIALLMIGLVLILVLGRHGTNPQKSFNDAYESMSNQTGWQADIYLESPELKQSEGMILYEAGKGFSLQKYADTGATEVYFAVPPDGKTYVRWAGSDAGSTPGSAGWQESGGGVDVDLFTERKYRNLSITNTREGVIEGRKAWCYDVSCRDVSEYRDILDKFETTTSVYMDQKAEVWVDADRKEVLALRFAKDVEHKEFLSLYFSRFGKHVLEGLSVMPPENLPSIKAESSTPQAPGSDSGSVSEAPRIAGIDPTGGTNDSLVTVTIDGKNLAAPMSARLKQAGHSDIVCPVNLVSSELATCVVDIRGQATGVWALELYMQNGPTATFSFEVREP